GKCGTTSKVSVALSPTPATSNSKGKRPLYLEEAWTARDNDQQWPAPVRLVADPYFRSLLAATRFETSCEQVLACQFRLFPAARPVRHSVAPQFYSGRIAHHITTDVVKTGHITVVEMAVPLGLR